MHSCIYNVTLHYHLYTCHTQTMPNYEVHEKEWPLRSVGQCSFDQKKGMRRHWKRSCFVCTVMYYGNLQTCSLIYCDKQLFPSAGIKAQLIRLYLVHYCTDCHTDPLCDLQRGWRRGKRQVLQANNSPSHTQARSLYHDFLTCTHLCPQTHKLHKHVKTETHCCTRGHMQPEATTQSFTVLQWWHLYYMGNCTRATDAVPCGD